MFRPITMYQVVCDRCGKLFEGTDTCESIFSGKNFNIGDYSDWEEIDGKHYCDACYEVEIVDDLHYSVKPKKGSMEKSEETITDFERGQWSVIQNVIGYAKNYSLAAELCREASIGYKKIKILQKDCGYSYKEEVNDFLKESRNGGTSLKLEE